MSYFLRGLSKIHSLLRVMTSYQYGRNSAVRSPVNSHQYTFTNNTVPNTELLVSNSTFNDLYCVSGESLVDTTLSIFKEITSLFYYYYRFNW